MKLRYAGCGTAALLLGVLAIGPAAAQPYPVYAAPYGPPPAYGPYGPPPAYGSPRYVPAYPRPTVLADDELPPGEIPGGSAPSVQGPYPVGPAQPSPYTGSVSGGGQEYAPSPGAAPRAAYPADPGAAPPPSASYPGGPAPAPTAPYPGGPTPAPSAAYPGVGATPPSAAYSPAPAYPGGPAPAPAGAYPGAPPSGAGYGPAGPAANANPPYGPDGMPRPPVAIDPSQRQAIAALPPEDQPETQPKELPAQFRRQLVDYVTKEPAGTIVVDTPNTYLYLVLGHGKAMRYGIGVGREGFTWTGVERISRMTEWPDWHPPSEMIDRQPYLPRMMAGGPGNPLGARALYLGKSLYRIHGTNQPSTIGQFVSSGCIRLFNDDIEDLYGRVTVGTRVVVLPGGKPPGPSASAQPPASPPQTPPSVR